MTLVYVTTLSVVCKFVILDTYVGKGKVSPLQAYVV